MIKAIQTLFQKASHLFSARHASDPLDLTMRDIPLRNFDEAAAKEAFRERFIKPFAPLVGEDMQAENMVPVVAYVKLAPISLPVMTALAVSGVGAPVALGASAGLAIYYAFFKAPREIQTLEDAINEITGSSPRDKKLVTSSIDRWMDKHIDQIPEYLDRLDRREENLRRREMLLKRLAKNPQTILPQSDRDLLARYDSRTFKTRAENPFSLKPHQSILGNWHYTQLYNAQRRDLRRIAKAKRTSVIKTLVHGPTN